MYERRHQPLIPRDAFLRRLAVHGGAVFALISFSLGAGVLGYRFIAGFPWVDALLNAAMILGGMGPVDKPPDDASKLFAAAYALYAGLVLLVSVGVLLAPALHRLLHHFHIEERPGGR